MSLQIGFRGQLFNTPTPLYAKVGAGMVVNTRTYKTASLASLQAAMTAEGYSAKPGEIELSTTSGWENSHTGWWINDGITPVAQPAGGGTITARQIQITKPTGFPITGDAGGTKTVTIGLGFGGKTLAADAAAGLSYTDASGNHRVNAALTAGMTGDAAAQAIATEIDKEANLGAVASGPDIVVTPTDGTVLSGISIVIV